MLTRIPMRRFVPATLVFLATLALYAATTHARVFSAGNDAARWATVESLVDHGTTRVEGSRFRGTVDRVVIDGREYANKPPLLSFAAAGAYALLKTLFGWSLAGPGAASVLLVVTLLVVGCPSAWLVARFHRALDRFPGFPPASRFLVTGALAAGTLLFSFSTTLNNHTVAAAFIFAGWIAALEGRGVATGSWFGVAAAIDLLPGLGVAAFALWRLHRAGERRAVGGALIALAAAGVAALVANQAHHGSPLPAKLVPGARDLAAEFGPSLGGVVLPQSWSYPLEILFGWHGLFVVSPVLLFGIWGFAQALRRPSWGSPDDWRWLAGALVLQVALHALVAGSYGGWSYGFRYLIPIQPLLLYAAPHGLVGGRRLAFAAVLPVSVLFAALGAFHPWPPAYEQATRRQPVASLVSNPIGGNAAAWLAVHAPQSALADWAGRRFVSQDPGARREYFALFYGSKGDVATMRRFAP